MSGEMVYLQLPCTHEGPDRIHRFALTTKVAADLGHCPEQLRRVEQHEAGADQVRGWSRWLVCDLQNLAVARSDHAEVLRDFRSRCGDHARDRGFDEPLHCRARDGLE